MSFKFTFANVLIGLHYVLLVLCVWSLGWLLALTPGTPWSHSDSDAMAGHLLAEYPSLVVTFALPLILLMDALSFIVKELGFRKHLMHVAVLDFVLIVLFVRGAWLFIG